MGFRFGIEVLVSDLGSGLEFRFYIPVWDSSLRIRFVIRFGGSGSVLLFGILFWDSDFRLRLGIKARDSCLGFRFAIQV